MTSFALMVLCCLGGLAAVMLAVLLFGTPAQAAFGAWGVVMIVLHLSDAWGFYE